MADEYFEVPDEEAESLVEMKDLDDLAWAIKKWQRHDRYAKLRIEQAEREIESKRKFIETVQRQTESRKQYLETLMEPLVRKMMKEYKVKSVSLAAGRVRIAAQHPEVVRDDKTLVEFIKSMDRPDLIDTVEKPRWGELKKELTLDGDKYVTKDGEIVPVFVVPRPDKVEVKFTEVPTR